MPKFGDTRWRIEVSADTGGGFAPFGHPFNTHHIVSERWTRDGWEGDAWVGLEAEDDRIPEEIRARARAIVAAWEAPPIESPEIRRWIKRCWSHWHNCYRIEGERDLFVMQPHPFWDLPTIEGRGLTMIINIANHYAVHYIRKFYPAYLPRVDDMIADCAACHHHINAHANGIGGECTVIVDPNGYKLAQSDPNYAMRDMLCLCPEFVMA